MNVKLCVQVLSNRVAQAIDACRKMGIEGFEDSEATTEFIRISNSAFDLMNSRPLGKGLKAPLTVKDKDLWDSFIVSTKQYYSELQYDTGSALRPLHASEKGTFVKGLVTGLDSIQNLMCEMEKGSINLK